MISCDKHLHPFLTNQQRVTQMIVFTVLGTAADSTEEQLREITARLETMCTECDRSIKMYIAFPMDRMQMDLGLEIVVQIASNYFLRDSFLLRAKRIFEEM